MPEPDPVGLLVKVVQYVDDLIGPESTFGQRMEIAAVLRTVADIQYDLASIKKLDGPSPQP